MSLLFIVIAARAAAAASKPPPPPHFTHALRMFLLVEEQLEELKWDAALGIIDAVYAELHQAKPELELTLGADDTAAIVADVARVRESVQAKDRGEGLKRSVSAETRLLGALVLFDYRVHPVLAIIDADVREAAERAARGDLRHAAYEIGEVSVYMGVGRKVLEERRVPPAEIDAFNEALRRASAALNTGDEAVAKTALEELRRKSSSFLER